MKYSALITLMALAIFVFTPDASAQVKINLKEKIKKEANKRANKKTDEKVKEGFDNLEKGIKGILGNEEQDSTTVNQQTQNQQQTRQAADQQQVNQQAGQEAEPSPSLKWSKYDFVPGDKVIFEDNHDGEENGEFPSRWDLVNGTVENAEFGGEKIIMFRGGSPKIIPYLKNPDIDYLPEVFTVEFDLWVNNHNIFQVLFFDEKNQRVSGNYRALDISYNGMNLPPAGSRLPDGNIENRWAHIAIAFTSGKFKAYIDDTRLVNIPHLEFDPMGISLYAYSANDNSRFYIKNFRLAEGGVKYYDRFLQDGKIVSNGIRFRTGSSKLLPESMGVINEIYKMLSDHPEINLSIEGHTDNVGDESSNQKLSEERAGSVLSELVNMGISLSRLSSTGHGESKPVDTNDTPEGKANNRRVEFVKK